MVQANDDAQQTALARELEAALDALTAPPVCCGVIRPMHPIALTLPDGTTVTFAGREGDERAIAALRAAARPAAFGDGRRTRIDPAVRNGLQLRAGTGLAVEHIPLAEVLEQIRAHLCPRAARLVAELHSVNVYEPGGHFAPHKDTPAGVDFVGTLVLALPTRFTGGQLRVAMHGHVTSLDWASELADLAQDAPHAACWAAFFGDADHDVADVSSGHRVTISYRLHLRGVAPPLALGAGAERLRAALARYAEQQRAYPRGVVLQVACDHLYPMQADHPTSSAIDDVAVAGLKGADADVAAAALAAGLVVTRQACLGDLGGDVVVELAQRFGEAEAAKMPARLDGDALEQLAVVPTLPRVALRGARARRSMFQADFSPTGYFGNEHSDTDFYAFTSLLLEVPAVVPRPPAVVEVTHAKFGRGEVLGQTGQGDRRAYRVRFADGERTILARFVEPATEAGAYSPGLSGSSSE